MWYHSTLAVAHLLVEQQLDVDNQVDRDSDQMATRRGHRAGCDDALPNEESTRRPRRPQFDERPHCLAMTLSGRESADEGAAIWAFSGNPNRQSESRLSLHPSHRCRGIWNAARCCTFHTQCCAYRRRNFDRTCRRPRSRRSIRSLLQPIGLALSVFSPSQLSSYAQRRGPLYPDPFQGFSDCPPTCEVPLRVRYA